jgi:peptidoglycan/LPS O-acetylase OafA/YrhL
MHTRKAKAITTERIIGKHQPIIDFKILDGLRGIAALYVVFNHARGNLFIGGVKYGQIKNISLWNLKEKIYFSALQLTSLGREFVILFFILSGFSIAFSLDRAPKIKSFYFRRIVRIYPPYIVALIWAYLVFKLLQTIAPTAIPPPSISVFSSFIGSIKNMLYIDNGSLIPQFWSLKYEVLFYLLIPFFILKKNLYFIISLLVGILSFFISWSNVSGVSILAQYILDYNIYFAVGVFCFHHYDVISEKITLKNKYLFFSIAVILLVTMVCFKFWIKYEMNKISLLIASLFSIILLFNFLQHNIRNGLLMFLGNLSYSIYITHFASLMLFKGLLLKTGIINSSEIQNKFLWIPGVFFATCISFLFYLLIEKPSKEYLKKLRRGNY